MNTAALKDIGLNEVEIEIYLALLQSEEATAGEIAEKTGLYRPYVYDIINTLIRKGIITYILINNKKYFRVISPDKLLKDLEKKQEAFSKILPELNSLLKEKQEPAIEIYKGIEGFLRNIEDQYSSNIIRGIGAGGGAVKIAVTKIYYLTKKFLKEGKKMRLILYDKVKKEDWFQKFTKEFKNKEYDWKTKFLPNRYISPSTTMIWNDKVSISLFYRQPMALVIKSKQVSDAYINYFNLLWKIAKS